jgi:6-phosphogluconate dehydrogenase
MDCYLLARLGVPVTLISEAVFSRCLSVLKNERIRTSKTLSGPDSNKYQGENKKFIHSIDKTLCFQDHFLRVRFHADA